MRQNPSKTTPRKARRKRDRDLALDGCAITGDLVYECPAIPVNTSETQVTKLHPDFFRSTPLQPPIVNVVEIHYGFTTRYVVRRADGSEETTFFYSADFAPFLANGGAA